MEYIKEMITEEIPQSRFKKIADGLRVFIGRMDERFFFYGIKILIRLMYRTKFIGVENIPAEGPAILICNHISYVDGLIITAASKRRVRFIVDEDIYNLPGVKYFMDLSKSIPIMATKDSVSNALEKVGEALNGGDLVCIFPEGVLTYTGNMTRFRFGVEWMVKQNNVVVVPMAIKGIWGSIFSRKNRKSKFRAIPRDLFRKVFFICGKPIKPEDAGINYLQKVVMELKDSADEMK